jgi:hypothetical protein
LAEDTKNQENSLTTKKTFKIKNNKTLKITVIYTYFVSDFKRGALKLWAEIIPKNLIRVMPA